MFQKPSTYSPDTIHFSISTLRGQQHAVPILTIIMISIKMEKPVILSEWELLFLREFNKVLFKSKIIWIYIIIKTLVLSKYRLD